MIRNVFMLVTEAARKYPSKIAYKSDFDSYTFEHIYDVASRIATALIGLDIKKKSIAVMLDKTPVCIATFFGIVGSNNFYTPLDIKMPKERVKKIYNTLNPQAIITSKNFESLDVFSGGGNCTFY